MERYALMTWAIHINAFDHMINIHLLFLFSWHLHFNWNWTTPLQLYKNWCAILKFFALWLICFSFVIIHAFYVYWIFYHAGLKIGCLVFRWRFKSLFNRWRLEMGESNRQKKDRKRERKKEELWLLSVLFISMKCQAQLLLRTSIDFCRLAWFTKYFGDCGRCGIHVLISLSLGYDCFCFLDWFWTL